MKCTGLFILLSAISFTGNAQRKWSINVEALAKRNFKYYEYCTVASGGFHFSAPVQLGFFALAGYQINNKLQLLAGIGISPSKYSLNFSLSNDTLKYNQKTTANIVALKFPFRLQYSLSKKLMIGGGLTVNYNTDWSREYTDNYAVDIPPINIAYKIDYPFFEKDYLTVSAELSFKFRLSRHVDLFSIASVDFGKQPAITAQNIFTTVNGATTYSYKTDPRLFYLGIGAACRLW